MKTTKSLYGTTSGGLLRKRVYLPPEMEAELRELAYRERRSESDILREALQEYLLNRGREGLR